MFQVHCHQAIDAHDNSCYQGKGVTGIIIIIIACVSSGFIAYVIGMLAKWVAVGQCAHGLFVSRCIHAILLAKSMQPQQNMTATCSSLGYSICIYGMRYALGIFLAVAFA
jgi:hypothetical protein